MRLLFSVAVLMLLACVVIEVSAAKSNRDTGATKDYHKSVNSKEVRYSKNKSEFKKKGNGKKQEVIKERKPRHNVEGKENIDSNEGLEKNRNDRKAGKLSYEEQKRQKSNKQNKIGKNSESFKNNKNIKVTKETTKKQKRSVEFEQPKESSINDATDSFPKNEESQLNYASKNVAANKFDKKSEYGNGKAVDSELEGEAPANIEGVSNNHPSEETTSSSDNKVKSSKKDKTAEQLGKSKKIKQQKHSHESEKLQEEIVASTKSESMKEVVQKSEEAVKSGKKSESVNDLPEEKVAGSVNEKKHESSKKTSETASKCECEKNDCKLRTSDTQKHVTEKSQKSKSGSCNLESEGVKDQNKTYTEKPKCTAEINIVDNTQQEAENEDSKNMDLNLGAKIEVEDTSVDVENCVRTEFVQENVKQESCSTE